MANTIITKNSATASAVPTSGDLVQGELAVNVTDKRLFTENSGGTVVELGTNPSQLNFADNAKAIFGAGGDLEIYHDGANSYVSDQGTGNLRVLAANFQVRNAANNAGMITAVDGGSVYLFDNGSQKLATTSTGIDVTGTVVSDGLTVNLTSGYARIQDLNTAVVSGTNMGGVEWRTGDSSVSGANRITARIRAEGDGTFNASDKAPTKLIFSTHTTSGVDPLDRMNIASNGDISFYEDTGTTAKFFWDASAESLGIGTSLPATGLHVVSSTGIRAERSGGASMTMIAGSGGEARLDTSILSRVLQVNSNGVIGLRAGSTIGNGDAAFTIDTSGNVGINRASPNGLLHMQSPSGTDSAFFIQTSSASDDSRINFGDNSSSTVGFLNYSHSDDSMRFGINSAERARITSAGDLLVGKTSFGLSNTGVQLSPINSSAFTADNSIPLYINRKTSDGALLEFRKNGVSVGSIGAAFSRPYFASPTCGISPHNTLNYVAPTNSTGITVNNTVDLGASAYRWKDLYLSGGVYVGGTAAANHLDDYEEGTFTPVVEGTTTTGTGTYTTQEGYYTKVGNLVTFKVRLIWTAHTGTGNIRFAGMPFTAGSYGYHAVSIQASDLSLGAGAYLTALFNSSTNAISPYNNPTGGGAVSIVSLDSAASVTITGQYRV